MVSKLATMDPNEWEVFSKVLKFRKEKLQENFIFNYLFITKERKEKEKEKN